MLFTGLFGKVNCTQSPVAQGYPVIAELVDTVLKRNLVHTVFCLHIMCFRVNYTLDVWHIRNHSFEFSNVNLSK